MKHTIPISETQLMTRRSLLTTAAVLSLSACCVGAQELAADADQDRSAADMPHAELLTDGNVITYLLVFRTGQEVMKGLAAFARKRELVSGHVTGIGALSDAVIGYFDPEKKTYLKLREEGQRELLSLTGNLALYDNAPFYHVHVALGSSDGHTRGGHLFAATARPTVELYLTAYARPVRRQIDPQWVIPLLSPSATAAAPDRDIH